MSDVRVVPATAREVRPLRALVLRPGLPVEESAYEQDDLPGTLHLAGWDDEGRLVGCATFFPEPWPTRPELPAWRLRGMATAQERRGTGLGGRLLVEGLDRASAAGAEVVWCNARTVALGFYRRYGFAEEGGEFLAAHGIPHLRMWRAIAPPHAH